VTGLTLDSLSPTCTAFVPGRRVDDNGHVMLRYQGRGQGDAVVQPGCHRAGERVRLRIYGTKAGLEWDRKNPNYLWVGSAWASRSTA
jgi:predicted dehydrogenase